ncbi:MAG: DUF935 domain-containing protein [Sulfurimicrobium sp.]|nr:DUF935 domain-containing protein [Sulfurimicrobium sp.]
MHYLSVLNTRKRAVMGLEISVEALSGSRADKRMAELARQAVPAVEAALFDLMDAAGKGFSVLEILWDTGAGQWLPRELVWRDPRWFQFDRVDGRTLLLRDDYNALGNPLPPYKFVRHLASVKSGLPVRGGIARAAAWSYLFQNYAIKDWVVFAEVFGQPIRLGKYEDGSTSPEQIQILLDALRAIGTDAAAAIPKSMEIELVSSSSRASADIYERLAQYMDAQISKLVLGQTLTTETGNGGGGSYALGKVHNEVRYDILHSDCRQITATLNRDLVRPLINLNFGPQAQYPKLVIRFDEPEDLAALSDNLAKVVPLGVPVPVKWALDKYGIPEAQDGEALLGQSATPDVAPSAQRSAHAMSQDQDAMTAGVIPVASGGIAAHTDAIDALSAAMSGDWKEVIAPMTDPVQAALDESHANGETAEQFLARLPELLQSMDPVALTEQLARSAFAARLMGEAGIDVGANSFAGASLANEFAPTK